MKHEKSLGSIQAGFPDLYGWVNSITTHGDFDTFVVVEDLESPEDGYVRVRFWTEENAYSIRARLPDEQNAGYLGCVASARKPLEGEDWTRGNDLPDGTYSGKTWRKIVKGILAYERPRRDISLSPPPVDEASM